MSKFSALRQKLLVALALPAIAMGANHREAPITALDHKADITDVYAFVSPENPDTVTMIMSVDPLLEPGNGPTYFPFDPDMIYTIKVDNNHDAREDIEFEFRFNTEFRIPAVYTAAAGFRNGAAMPGTGAVVIPPRIEDFTNPGLIQAQTYDVTMVKKDRSGREMSRTPLRNSFPDPFFAVPGNAGARTMDYEALYNKGTYDTVEGVKVFAGTTDDGFWIDLGGAFDTFNVRTGETGVPGVMSDAEDTAESNFGPDFVSGYSVNSIAIQVPIEDLTNTGRKEGPREPAATIGVWATTERPSIRVLGRPTSPTSKFRQVQRMGNPLINELIIGIGAKDKFSMSEPRRDDQFAPFFLNPPIALIVEALYNELAPGALTVPKAPRVDLLPLVQYLPPIVSPESAANTPTGPIADILRLNTSVPPTPYSEASRLGLIGGDPAGFPNGRRVFDDVVDIVLRVGVGGVLTVDENGDSFNRFPNNRLGDGVNINDVPYNPVFPYLGLAPDGAQRQHIDPGEDLSRSTGGIKDLGGAL